MFKFSRRLIFGAFVLKTAQMFSTYAAELAPHSIFGHSSANSLFPTIIQQLGDNFGKSIPQSAQDNAQMQSIYNFFFQ